MDILDGLLNNDPEAFSKVFETLRQAKPTPKPAVQIGELIRRKSSLVRADGKLYRIEVVEVSE